MRRFDEGLSLLYRMMCYGVYPLAAAALLLFIYAGAWGRLVTLLISALLVLDGATMAGNMRGVMGQTLQRSPWMRIYGSNELREWRTAGRVLVTIGAILFLSVVVAMYRGR